MYFNSTVFFVLLISTFISYYIVPKKFQILVVICANFIFYAYHTPKLLILLLFSASMDAFLSYGISRYNNKKTLAVIGVTSELLLLSFFKYSKLLYGLIPADFSSQEVVNFLMTIPLPVGISFYCFQGISMLIDTYRGEIKFEKVSLRQHFTRTIFFVSFFPHLVAGPIVKAGEFIPQIGPKYFNKIEWDVVLKNLVIGFFFKVVIADNLAIYTQYMSSAFLGGQSSLNLAFLIFAYSCQIFADFAGYSYIAIGLAALFEYQFPQNFNYPYISVSFSEFWTRWHMSLSKFLRNYLYIPLGGNRKGNLRCYLNLMIVMLLGGIWHGAQWSYAIWGLWHGLWLIGERLLSMENVTRRFSTVPQAWLSVFRIFMVFSVVSIGWVLFRFPDFRGAEQYFFAIKNNQKILIDFATISKIIIFSSAVVLHHILYLLEHSKTMNMLKKADFLMYAGLLFLIFTCSGDRFEFIYFQF